ncbi:MAG: nucleotidyltransferase domain-containing protein [Patescibacteria group bacterium]
MAKKTVINKEIKEVAFNFSKAVEKQGIPIKKLIIFGSYAKGNARPESDIDICVVSPKFGKDSIKELQFLFKIRREIDSRIEPFSVSWEEYKKTASPIIFEIKQFGQEIS